MISRRTFLKGMMGGAAASLLGSAIYAYQTSELRVSKEQVVLAGVRRRVRVVAVSDVHAPCLYSSMVNFTEAIEQAEPDVLLLLGDIVEKKGCEGWVRKFGEMKTNCKKVAILGNWEYYGGCDPKKLGKEYGKAGVDLLVNDAIEVNGLVVIGLDDLLFGRPDYGLVKRGVKMGKPLLLLGHCPKTFDPLAKRTDVSFSAISGHTHGGQIAPFGKALATPKGSGRYVRGWYEIGHNRMYVTSGIGTSGLPIRIGANPEVLILDVFGKEV